MYNKFVVEGVKMTTELLQSPTFKIEGIYALESWLTANEALLFPYQNEVQLVSNKDLERISSLKTPNQVLVVCTIPTYPLEIPTINESLTLFLDDLQNPGNLGSILRVADWFGLPYVFCSPNTVEAYNPKVIQGSMGAFLRVKTVTIEFENLIQQVPDLPTYATVLDGENVFTKEFSPNGIIVIGNEGDGVSSTIAQRATHQISIPKGKKGRAESLNAAVATGIFCAAFLNA